ncbi:MerR family transcriptional regulator [Microlunatus parietis]|uniref:MerR family transcriptional regulator n=1 Tax=Microlunatus parietis TaxID=682979 RepID=UPI0015C95A20|nr:MerR family transcriptional regulator [Microlunatus parietis]
MSTYQGLRPAEVAAAVGINPQTLRYYERRGLIEEPDRSLGGHRLYPDEVIMMLRVIKTTQRLGFSLDEIADLLELAGHRHPAGEGAGFRRRAEAKLSDVEARIAELQVIAETLRNAIAAGCDDLLECVSIPGCPIPFAEAGGRPT